ncbi:MAG: hypothetical protein ACRD2W_20650 [Acidimicrobiales bacterium]
MLRRLRAPSLESLFIAALVLLGFRLGALPIGDNSMFTHLRTGVDMVAGAGIPRTDPYSYTARGAEWVVQSWLPAWTYGWLERIGGVRLVVLEQAVLMAILALLIARLARAGSPLRTALSAGLAVSLGAPMWSPRPLIFGLICMALTVGIVERRRTPWLLVPVVWLWVSSHGSFPIGLVWLGTRAAGEWLDWKSWPRETARYAWAFLGSLVVAVINPLGAKLLLFPLTLGEKASVFEKIVEWQSPNFHRAGERFALVILSIVVVLLYRARLTWRDAVPSMVFLALTLYAVRNLPLLAIVLAPVLQRIMRRPEGASPRPSPTGSQLRTNRALAAVIGVAFILFGIGAYNAEPLRLRAYPVEAADFLDDSGLVDDPHRIVHQDVVGNFLELRFGRDASVFIDDRVDMYPVQVSRDYLELLRGGERWVEILDRYGVDVVLWDRQLPLAQLLRRDIQWRETFRHGDWIVYQRTFR